MKLSRDQNGNKTLKVEAKDLPSRLTPRGFSVQTLGNLPETHAHGVHYATKGELFQFISEHGTAEQRTALNCDTEISINDIQRGRYYRTNDPVFRDITDNDITELVDLLGGRKKDQLKSALRYNLEAVPHWAQERIVYNHGRWSYTAGQDYTNELNLIRKALIN